MQANWHFLNWYNLKFAKTRCRLIFVITLLQEFNYVDRTVKVKIFNIFATSFYGSGLWDLYSSEVDRIYKSWNVSVRLAFGVPCTTHRYMIEPMSGSPHPKTMLSTRYVKLIDSLCSSSKLEVSLLANLAVEDNRTVMGRTVSRVKQDLGCQDLTPMNVKKKLKYFPTPECERWRLDFLRELLSVSCNQSTIENLSQSDAKNMLAALCTS